MIIYPKTSDTLEGMNNLKPYIEKYKGVEIQMMEWDSLEKVNSVIKNVKNEVPEIQEITIHPPLREKYNFEALSYRELETEIERIKCIRELSKEYDIKLNLLYHTRWNYESWKSSGGIDAMKELLNLIKETNVTILIENIYSIVDKKDSAVLRIAKNIDSEKLKVCLDICHLHCQANIFDLDFDEFLNNYLDKDDCKRYIYQIHYAGTLNNDGYRIEATHGRKHDKIENFQKDFEILKEYGIEDKIIVTEVSENDYLSRKDQIEEIKMLEKNVI